MPVSWVEVRYACDCQAIVSVSAVTEQATCERCGKLQELGPEWDRVTGPESDDACGSILEVTLRPSDGVRCHACERPLPESHVDGIEARSSYRCPCGASICVRPTPQHLVGRWAKGILVGEDEDRLDQQIARSTRGRPRRRFYFHVPKEESDRVTKELPAARQKSRLDSRSDTLTLLAGTLVLGGVAIGAVRGYEASLGSTALHIVAGFIAFGIVVLFATVHLRFARYRARPTESAPRSAHRYARWGRTPRG